jgi:hypothetical protein
MESPNTGCFLAVVFPFFLSFFFCFLFGFFCVFFPFFGVFFCFFLVFFWVTLITSTTPGQPHPHVTPGSILAPPERVPTRASEKTTAYPPPWATRVSVTSTEVARSAVGSVVLVSVLHDTCDRFVFGTQLQFFGLRNLRFTICMDFMHWVLYLGWMVYGVFLHETIAVAK